MLVEKDNEHTQTSRRRTIEYCSRECRTGSMASLDPLISDKAGLFDEVQTLHFGFGRLKKLVGRGHRTRRGC
jgi:hypothetical protein